MTCFPDLIKYLFQWQSRIDSSYIVHVNLHVNFRFVNVSKSRQFKAIHPTAQYKWLVHGIGQLLHFPIEGSSNISKLRHLIWTFQLFSWKHIETFVFFEIDRPFLHDDKSSLKVLVMCWSSTFFSPKKNNHVNLAFFVRPLPCLAGPLGLFGMLRHGAVKFTTWQSHASVDRKWHYTQQDKPKKTCWTSPREGFIKLQLT